MKIRYDLIWVVIFMVSCFLGAFLLFVVSDSIDEFRKNRKLFK